MNAHARHVTAAKPISLNTIARQMFDEARGDMAAATEKLANYVSQFPRLSDELLRIGARKLLNEIPQVERKASAAARGEHDSATFVASAPFRINDPAKRARERISRLGATSRNA